MTRRNPDRRTLVRCSECRRWFLRRQNTRYCGDLCRIVNKAVPDGECWRWTATLDRHGYGTTWLEGRKQGAHRASFILHRGPIPEGLDLDHLCRNRSCINPWHLEPVDRATNCRRGARWSVAS